MATIPDVGSVAAVRRAHFGCSRCGACCNSAPQLSLPELFHHQARFVGCLGIRRAPGAPQSVSAVAQAYDDPLLGRCVALGDDNGCRLQHDNKPLACRAVPLEASLPDSLQFSVLEARARDAAFMGAHCIQLQGHLPVIVEGGRVVDAESERALELRRRALRLDQAYWGDRVCEMLGRDLFEHSDRFAVLPEHGYFCLSLAPALSVVSSFSNALTRRVIAYLNAQIELIALTVGAPVKEPTQAERELAGMLRANLALRTKLGAARPLPEPAPQAAEVEAWLGAPSPEAVHA